MQSRPLFLNFLGLFVVVVVVAVVDLFTSLSGQGKSSRSESAKKISEYFKVSEPLDLPFRRTSSVVFCTILT